MRVGEPAGAATAARTVEIREYQGEKLGSVGDFRENSIRDPQKVDSASYRLVIDGLVARPVSLTLSELLEYPATRRLVVLHCVEGWSVKVLWEGIRLAALLDSSGPDPSANTVIFHAADGYTSSLPLAFVRGRDLILAHKMNGVVLPPERGYPLQLVAEDRWGYKWVKWLTRIELSADSTYRGFWERRGYNNDGGLEGPFRETGR